MELTDRDTIRAELQAIAAEFDDTLRIDSGSDLESFRDELRSAELADEYATWSPLAARFVEAELDAEAPSKRGMGRLLDAEPPPRLGAKYREVLQSPVARDAIQPAAERTVLGGFAAATVLYEQTTARDLDTDVVWERFLNWIPWGYNHANDTLGDAASDEPTEKAWLALLTIQIAGRGLKPLREEFERLGILKSRRLMRSRNLRALTYLGLFLGAGRALRMSITEDAEKTVGTVHPAEALEDYREPRKLI